MTGKKELMERREHERFKIKHGAIAMIRPLPAQPEQTKDISMGGNALAAKPKFCQIINISKGVPALRYIDRNGESNESFKLNVSFAQDSIKPSTIKGYRNVLCPYYNHCLSHAVKNHWKHWACLECQYKSKQYLIYDTLLSSDSAYPYYSLSPSMYEKERNF